MRPVVVWITFVNLVYLLIQSRRSNNLQQLAFEPFNPALLQAARSERKPVVIDFAADWEADISIGASQRGGGLLVSTAAFR